MSNKKSKLLYLLFIFLILFLFPKKVGAVTINIINYPSTISTNSFNIDVFVNGPSDGKNYLRVDLYKDGTTHYFGETFNGNEWYSGSSGTNYFAVDVINSTASATLSGRIGDPTQTEYLGPGQYKLRIRRYTSSGSYSSTDQQTPVDVSIEVSTPTPEPTIAPTNNPTSDPTNSPTVTSTASSIPTKTPTPKPAKTSTPEPTQEEEIMQEVLGIQNDNVSPTPLEDTQEEVKKPKVSVLAILFIILGISFVGFSGFAFFKQKGLNNRESEKNNTII